MLHLPPALTHAQASASLAQLCQGLAQQPSPVQVDASALQQFDSSALAVLLELRRVAAGQQQTVQFLHLPTRLQDLAALYGVQDLLLHA